MVWPVSSDRWKAPLVNRYNGFFKGRFKPFFRYQPQQTFHFHIFGLKNREAMRP